MSLAWRMCAIPRAARSGCSQPDHIEPDPREARARHYRRGVGPSRWLLVVVSYEQEPARIVTALATRKDPTRWKR